MTVSVYLHVYDLSKGLAKQLSHALIGKHIEGIWHTGIVVYGREWFFGGNGIENCLPKGTLLKEPDEIVHLGNTEICENDFLDMIDQLTNSLFAYGTYNLFEHNCNTFSNHLSQFLVGKPIPIHITALPNDVLQTSFGLMIKQFLQDPTDMISNKRDKPLSHINKKTGQTISLSSSAALTNKSTCVQDNIKQKEKFTKLNEPIIYMMGKIKDEEFNLIKTNTNASIIDDVRSYFEQKKTDIKWTISFKHINMLYNLLNESNHESELVIVNILKLISLDENVYLLLKNDVYLINLFNKLIDKVNKNMDNSLLIKSYFQLLCNITSHIEFNEWIMSTHQDFLFSNICEYILHKKPLIYDSTIELFFNLLCVYDNLYNMLTETNSFQLGCALIEIINNETYSNDKILNILDLTQICCTNSKDMISYVQSIGGLNLDRHIHDNKCKNIIDAIYRKIND